MNRPPGRQGRLLAVGDIHGCLAPLERLLGEVCPRAEDRVVFLGDYIDRGPDSAGVVELLLSFAAKHPQTIFLRGNHEQMLLGFLSDRDPLAFLANGGSRVLLVDLDHQLLDYWETSEYIFVHAGLRPGVPLAEQDPLDLLWIRDDFLSSPAGWGKTVVYGHTPLHEPLLTAERIGLDTGCVYGRRLTCCDVYCRQVWSA